MFIFRRKKYKLTNEAIKVGEFILYRIKAIKNFGTIKKGDLGGYIEKERNLSPYDNCWVFDNAQVYGNGYVSENATISDDAKVYGIASVSGEAQISGNARVYGEASIFDSVQVCGKARVCGTAEIYDNEIISTGVRD
ncbi:hypothetical protein [Bartonella sp. AA74HLJMH]|uniref:hypothetical protein n=1 Tax=Bartonella sp. AA74HLJMH TaxID=3243436 RepID=UPI0035D0EEFA